jgi:hypothetical protein
MKMWLASLPTNRTHSRENFSPRRLISPSNSLDTRSTLMPLARSSLVELAPGRLLHVLCELDEILRMERLRPVSRGQLPLVRGILGVRRPGRGQRGEQDELHGDSWVRRG